MAGHDRIDHAAFQLDSFRFTVARKVKLECGMPVALKGAPATETVAHRVRRIAMRAWDPAVR